MEVSSDMRRSAWWRVSAPYSWCARLRQARAAGSIMTSGKCEIVRPAKSRWPQSRWKCGGPRASTTRGRAGLAHLLRGALDDLYRIDPPRISRPRVDRRRAHAHLEAVENRAPLVLWDRRARPAGMRIAPARDLLHEGAAGGQQSPRCRGPVRPRARARAWLHTRRCRRQGPCTT
jgi:hypothetical protein